MRIIYARHLAKEEYVGSTPHMEWFGSEADEGHGKL